MIPKCRKCSCPCILISLNCFFDSVTILTQDDVDTHKVIAIMDLIQKNYIRPYLGKECFTELCNALAVSDLPPNDPSYVALPEKWEEFINEAKALIALATEHRYYVRYSLANPTKERVKFDDADKDIVLMKLNMIKSEINEEEESLQKWLCENKKRFGCVSVKCDKCTGTQYCGCSACSGDLDKYADDDCVECWDDPATTFGWTTTKHVKPDPRTDPNWYKRNRY